MKKLIYALFIGLTISTATAQPKFLEQGSILVIDKSVNKYLDSNCQIEILAEGHEWTEGPLWIPSIGKLLYCDIPRNSIYSWSEQSGVEVYLTPSGFLGENFKGYEPGSNGLTLNAQEQLVLCQHGERQVAILDAQLSTPKSKFKDVATDYEGKRLNSPNDLVFASNGNLYFTDPPYGLPQQMDDPNKELTFQGVYLVKDGNTMLLTKELSRPNGVALSPDERTLYVTNSDPDNPILMKYPIQSDGSIKGGSLFFDAAHLTGDYKGLPDGLKVHPSGIVFTSGPGGILILSPEGKHIGSILTGEATSNCTFSPDYRSLFITADSYVLSVKLKQ